MARLTTLVYTIMAFLAVVLSFVLAVASVNTSSLRYANMSTDEEEQSFQQPLKLVAPVAKSVRPGFYPASFMRDVIDSFDAEDYDNDDDAEDDILDYLGHSQDTVVPVFDAFDLRDLRRSVTPSIDHNDKENEKENDKENFIPLKSSDEIDISQYIEPQFVPDFEQSSDEIEPAVSSDFPGISLSGNTQNYIYLNGLSHEYLKQIRSNPIQADFTYKRS